MKKNNVEKLYETMIIWDAGLPNDEVDGEITKVKELIETNNGECLKIDKWGKRRLAYEIKMKREGVYVVIDFKGSTAILSQLFEHFKFDKNVIRHLTLEKTGQDSQITELKQIEFEEETVSDDNE